MVNSWRKLAQSMVVFMATFFCYTGIYEGPAYAASFEETQDLRLKLEDFATTLQSDGVPPDETLSGLLKAADLPSWDGATGLDSSAGKRSASVQLVQKGRASVSTINLRIALAILSQSYGGRDNLVAETAERTRGNDALSFRGGTVTLEDILDGLVLKELQPQQTINDGLIRAPVILWEDTTLVLGPEDHLALSRADGAFLISFGRVEIDGSVIEGTDEENATSPEFRPFVTIAGGGSASVRNATLKNLGFGNTAKFSGLSVVTNRLIRSTGRSALIDSHIENLVTVAFAGTDAPTVTGNQFYNMRNNALLMEQSPYALIASNLFYGTSPTNAIRVLAGSSDAKVLNNVILEGDRAGILVRQDSRRVQVIGNLIWSRYGGSIKLLEAECGFVHNNVIAESRQKSIEVRYSADVTISENVVVGGHSAAIWLSEQPGGAKTYVMRNFLHSNGSGIATANGGTVYLVDNDLTGQLPKLIAGDITTQAVTMVKNMTNPVPIAVNSASTRIGLELVQPDCGLGATQ